MAKKQRRDTAGKQARVMAKKKKRAAAKKQKRNMGKNQRLKLARRLGFDHIPDGKKARLDFQDQLQEHGLSRFLESLKGINESMESLYGKFSREEFEKVAVGLLMEEYKQVGLRYAPDVEFSPTLAEAVGLENDLRLTIAHRLYQRKEIKEAFSKLLELVKKWEVGTDEEVGRAITSTSEFAEAVRQIEYRGKIKPEYEDALERPGALSRVFLDITNGGPVDADAVSRFGKALHEIVRDIPGDRLNRFVHIVSVSNLLSEGISKYAPTGREVAELHKFNADLLKESTKLKRHFDEFKEELLSLSNQEAQQSVENAGKGKG